MIRRNAVAALILLSLGALPAPALEPVVIAGADVGYRASVLPVERVHSVEVRPRLAFNWRERLSGGTVLVVDARAHLWVPLEASGGLSDGEYLNVTAIIPSGNNETSVSVGAESAFVANGVAARTIIPRWSADYRRLSSRGHLALLTRGRYRVSLDGRSDVLMQRIGIGFQRAESISLSIDAAVAGGVEVWPEYVLVDQSGAATGQSRRDATVDLDLTAEGLWGYFTSWSIGGLAELRISNATGFRTDSATFLPNPESLVSGNLFASIRTSPVRQVSITGSVTVDETWYTNRVSRDLAGAELGANLSIFTATAQAGVDYNPVGNLFLVASLEGSAQFSTEPWREGWYTQVQLGAEYSF